MDSMQLRACVGSWPGVTEDIKWGCDLVFSVADKMFCVIDATPAAQGGSGRLSFKVDDDRFLELTDRPGILPAPYMARAKWICLAEPGAMSDAELKPLLRRSYELVRAKLTKAKQRELGEG
ncbi:MAG: MmcQ/YjbR family DNA-binding protein [Xanthomonadaceae bacterium]|nr:MmcQ/YjbR family DNA-binding protein [Xanthomonadaceae bacterium]